MKSAAHQLAGFTAFLLLEDLLSDVLAQAERGGGAVVPGGTQAVMGRPRKPLRHQQLHVNGTVGHQKLVGSALENKEITTTVDEK